MDIPDVDKSMDTNEEIASCGTLEVLLGQGSTGTGTNR